LYIEDWKMTNDKTPDIPLTEDDEIDDNCDSMEVLVVLADGKVTIDNFDFHSFSFEYHGEDVIKWTHLPIG
jgi:hypothetical protein